MEKRERRLVASGLIGAVLMFWTECTLAAPEHFFTEPPSVKPVRISLNPDSQARLSDHPHEYVAGTLAVAEDPPSVVHLRLRGHGSFRPITDKPNFAIQSKGLGRRKVLLSGSSQDPTYLRWKLASEMFLKVGLPAARIGFARVELNGRDLGLYLSVEPTDKQFLKHRFGSSAGNLYEGSNNDVVDPLELDSGRGPGSADILKALASACHEPDLDRRWRLLDASLDVRRFASFAAMEVLVCHHDGYSLDRNNFRIYQDPTSGRFVFIPHGMDLIFDNPTAPLLGRWRGLVAHAFMETSEGRKLYREAVVRSVESVYAGAPWPERIDEWARLLRLEMGSGEALRTWEAAVIDLKRIVEQRHDFVLKAVGSVATYPK